MFICMDKTPETVVGREANNNGAVLYHVEASCGTGQLPSPNFDGSLCGVHQVEEDHIRSSGTLYSLLLNIVTLHNIVFL